MPNKDGTGPLGKGSKTGKQRGNCEGAEPCGQNRNLQNCRSRNHERRCKHNSNDIN